MFIGWCFQSQLVFSCTNRHQNKPIFIFLMFIGWCFQSQLVLSCTNRHQTKPIFSCLCLLGGAFSRNLYFRVQTGTKPNLFLVVYVYWVVLSVATCTFVYKQAPKQTYLTGGPIHLLLLAKANLYTWNVKCNDHTKWYRMLSLHVITSLVLMFWLQ